MPASADDVVSMVFFARVVESQSFSGAATRMGLSKSAVSNRISRLEERLGTRLLNRTTRRLSLTEAGLEFYKRCARLAAEADEATESVSGLSHAVQGTLRVNAPVVFATTHLAPALPGFLESYPSLRVELTVDDHFIDVAHGGYDVVVRVASTARMKDSSAAARKLATDRMVVCGSPAYFARMERPRTPEELLRHHCLRYANNALHEEWLFGPPGKTAAVPVTGPFATNSGMVLRSAALAGLGVAILPRFMVADVLASGALELVLEDVRWPDLGIYALTPARRQAPAKVRAFIDFLAAHFRRGLDGPPVQRP
ncbi:MAG TPA: LysR family transcriptional regulator [Myxococcaceae bacterium]|jgi:DNA-binding transcriptional LysR family regulator